MPMNIKNISTCPKCGHPVGWWRKLRAGFLTYPCKNCGTIWGVNYWKRQISILIFLLLLYLWIRPEVITPLNFMLAGCVLLDILGKMFISPIVEKGPSQKSDSE